MFDGSDFPQSLDESLFESWLETGRESKIRYSYLFIIWNEFESQYIPVYAESRSELQEYEPYHVSTRNESIIAAYDLFSESRISLQS